MRPRSVLAAALLVLIVSVLLLAVQYKQMEPRSVSELWKSVRLLQQRLRVNSSSTNALKSIASFRLTPSASSPELKVCQQPVSMSAAQAKASSIAKQPAKSKGGFWWPTSCWPALSSTAVLVPYRNRSENLKQLLPHLQSVLRQQNIMFGLFVIEQADNKLFNRAKLLNIGYKTALKFYNFSCFILHDADKLPENAANMYDCSGSPKLLISEMRGQKSTKYKGGILYTNFFGGVTAISRGDFALINGNSNAYFGWGREDDELSARLRIRGKRIRYSTGSIARYVNIQHADDIVVNKMPWPHDHAVKTRINTDGLNSLNYTDKGVQLMDNCVLVRAAL